MSLRLNPCPCVSAALAVALLLACSARKAEFDSDGSDSGTGETGSTGGASATGEPDSTSGQSSGHGGTAKHAACDSPFPDPAPAVPSINREPDARPSFDVWTDLDCDALSTQPCGLPGDPTCNGNCLRGVEGGPGVCTHDDIDIWCDGEGEALAYGEGACWVCSPPEVRALACCQFPDGFDCRAWPYPSDGPPNSICARHEDCEPGLVCGPHRGSGYGLCQCPGADAESLAPPQSCF